MRRSRRCGLVRLFTPSFISTNDDLPHKLRLVARRSHVASSDLENPAANISLSLTADSVRSRSRRLAGCVTTASLGFAQIDSCMSFLHLAKPLLRNNLLYN